MGVSSFFAFGCWLVLILLRQFQCRQCQDLLENNLAHKRPIEGLCFGSLTCKVVLTILFLVLVGKKNLEVRPTAVNKVCDQLSSAQA